MTSTASFAIIAIVVVPVILSSVYYKPQSCSEVKQYLKPSESGYFTLYDSGGNSFKSFCDFQPKHWFTWTFLESLIIKIGQYQEVEPICMMLYH
ncbi:hypothetical protein TrispH2_001771 [Trichoplax sp. H2]|nr:hypothetical protein TrispH2_001771 [Trichoplax sp. H2]|eukprot:RDD46044.1 hypothetical protein TrispH2_001771 [Trichoplax sp. H2]